MNEAAEPIEPLPEAEPEAMARALQALLDEKDAELAAAKDQMLRAMAEADNTRRHRSTPRHGPEGRHDHG